MDLDGNGSFSEKEFVEGMLFCMRARPIDNGRRFLMMQAQMSQQQRAIAQLSSDMNKILKAVEQVRRDKSLRIVVDSVAEGC